MAPRKNAKRVEDEPVETAARGGDVTPPKKKKTAVQKSAITDEPREVRLPRAAKNKKPEPVEEVPAPVKKPVKPKAAKMANDVEEDSNMNRVKTMTKKTQNDMEESDAKPHPKGRSKKTVKDQQPAKAESADDGKKMAPKSKGGAKKVEAMKSKEAKPKGRAAEKIVEKVGAVTEVASKIVKTRGKNAVKVDESKDEEEEEVVVQKRRGQKKLADITTSGKVASKGSRAKKTAASKVTEEPEEAVIEEADEAENFANAEAEILESQSDPEENGVTDELKENGNTEHDEHEAEEPKATKKGKGRQPIKKGKVVFKTKSFDTESTDDDAINSPAVDQIESH
ncbi:ABC transporter F family member 4-like [Diprion similis]|uniref:ABC transporter F family member 4-like n=1 Tax=Diprion similis TaxID=362088 RepID=UPI001EF91966|nr:ABC transporter F family member 4-like [Diprion similis]XP_046733867.1 ABC transporter F family member 4-like [Diprion similis]